MKPAVLLAAAFAALVIGVVVVDAAGRSLSLFIWRRRRDARKGDR